MPFLFLLHASAELPSDAEDDINGNWFPSVDESGAGTGKDAGKIGGCF
jgi:hypothetical protein